MEMDVTRLDYLTFMSITMLLLEVMNLLFKIITCFKSSITVDNSCCDKGRGYVMTDF